MTGLTMRTGGTKIAQIIIRTIKVVAVVLIKIIMIAIKNYHMQNQKIKMNIKIIKMIIKMIINMIIKMKTNQLNQMIHHILLTVKANSHKFLMENQVKVIRLHHLGASG